MKQSGPLQPVDYLVIGHFARDLTPSGVQLGGTAAYSALTAAALGQSVGIVTAHGDDVPLAQVAHLPMVYLPSEKSTTFENIATSNGRIQILHHQASLLGPQLVPSLWQNTPIVHIGPIAQEIDLALLHTFSPSTIHLTPQGWLRSWDEKGRIHPADWPEAPFVLPRARATVLSTEDVGGDQAWIDEMASYCPILVVTEAAHGAQLYYRGEIARYEALPMREVDAVGAGDIFAAAFFVHLRQTGNPFQAAHFATRLASFSVARKGLDSIPTPEEIQECLQQDMRI